MNRSRWFPGILLSACWDVWTVGLYFSPNLEIKPIFINVSRCAFFRMYISSWGNISLTSVYLPDQAYQLYYSDVQLLERWITKLNQDEQIFLPTPSSRLLHVDLRPGYQPTHLQSHRPFYCLTSVCHLLVLMTHLPLFVSLMLQQLPWFLFMYACLIFPHLLILHFF